MRILVIHNDYGNRSGEENAVENISKLYEDSGHEVTGFRRSSSELSQMRFGRTCAFFSGVYSLSSKKALRKHLAEVEPDVVHVHNLFPLISPSVLGECRRHGVPVLMTVHNYRLICPSGLFLRDGKICEECSGGREWRCVVHNCERSIGKSVGYALRNWVARKRRAFLDNVTAYIALTEFQKRRLIQEGFPADRIHVIGNMADSNGIKQARQVGDYVGFVGRISPEKGVSTLIKAAGVCQEIQFKAAGSYDRMPDAVEAAPENFEFCGHLDKEQLDEFYSNSRMIVLSSVCYEGFPSVLLEAMLRGKPVISSRIGGLAEIVEDGETGLLFEPGNADELAEKIQYLWTKPALCREMGQAGREKTLREYSPEKYYERLMATYNRAVELNGSNRSRGL